MEWKLTDGRPIWVQLHEQLRQRIATPSVRELAAEAGVNPNTLQRALAQLEADGLVSTNRTAGRTVTEDGVVLSRICIELANERIREYLHSMALLGFTKDEAVELLKKWEE